MVPVAGPIDPDHVEAAAVIAETRVFRQVDAGRLYQLPLLAGVDGRDGVNERSAASITDLDENETVAVEHDQVDLAVAAVEVTRDRSQPGALQLPVR